MVSKRDVPDILRSIISVAETAKQHGVGVPVHSMSPPISVTVPSHLLPLAQPIVDRFTSVGTPIALAKQVSDSYIAIAEKYRKSMEDDLRRTLTLLANSRSAPGLPPVDVTLARLRKAVETIYLRTIAQCADEKVAAEQAKWAATGTTELLKKRSKRPFNQEYVPLLEHFFSENPRPSHADKTFLAKKTAMSFKQIHIWFQNRRCRVRKGIRIGRSSPTPTVTFEALLERLGDKLIPEDARIEPCDPAYPDDDVTDDHPLGVHPSLRYDPDAAASVFNYKSPPHAFPATYPPVCQMDTFPIKHGVRHFPLPEWPRCLATAPVHDRPPVDMTVFCSDFDGLSVRESSQRPRRVRQREDALEPSRPKKRVRTGPSTLNPHCSAATLFITTNPLPAPLPSVHVSSLESRSPLRAPIPAPTSRRHVFHTSSPCSLPLSMSAAASASTRISSRKVAPLPRRIPAVGLSSALRDVSPAMSDVSSVSPSRYPVLASRSTSFNSISDLRKPFMRSSSDSSASSSDVESPLTPPRNTVELPSSSPLSFSPTGEPVVVRPSDSSTDGGLHLDLLSNVTIVQAGVDKAVRALVGHHCARNATVRA